jgi:hypothetical protein
MKFVISSDFVRGVLFSAVAGGAYWSLKAMQIGLTFQAAGHKMIQLTGALLLFVLHIALCVALLVRATHMGKAVFTYFSAVAVVQIGVACYCRIVIFPQGFSSFGISLLPALYTFAMIALSHAFCNRRFPEQVA